MDWRDFSSSAYHDVYAQQKTWVQHRIDDVIPDTVLMGEHDPVLTLGRGTDVANVLVPSIPTVSIERGGDVTYHGPGQLVVYPIVKLTGSQKDLHQYLRNLEQVVIDTLKEFDIEGVRFEPEEPTGKIYTGVWVKGGEGAPLKIASVGVAVKRWVTYHGLALNVSTDLSAYQLINPCGFSAEVMTSMETLLGKQVRMEDVKRAVKKATHRHLMGVQ